MSNPKPHRSHIKKSIYRGLIALRAFDQVRMLTRFLLENNIHVVNDNYSFPARKGNRGPLSTTVSALVNG